MTKRSLEESSLIKSKDNENSPKSTGDNEGERKVMLLIHGSGVVRGGQWARR